MERDEMAIGELAARFGLATHVLRHWESVGLLSPARRANGRRVYNNSHLMDVVVIRLCKEVGLSLDQTRSLMSVCATQAARAAVLGDHTAVLRARIARMHESLELLEHAMCCEAEEFRSCPDFNRKVDRYLSGLPRDGRTAAAAESA